MKPDRNTKVGAIMQISPADEQGNGKVLMVVEKVHSWGVAGYLPNTDGTLSRTWDLIEPTGGVVAFERDGKPFKSPPPPQKHHP